MTAPFTPALIAFALVVVFFAFLVRGVAGFGANLVLAPLLAAVLDVRQVVGMSTILTLAVGAYLVFSHWRANDLSAVRGVIWPAGLMAVVGAWLLSSVHANFLLLLLGGLSILYAGYSLILPDSPRLRFIGRSRLMRLGLGGLSGLLHGMYGTGGPPVVILYSQLTPNKATFRASLNALFLALDLIRASLYLALAAGGQAAAVMNVQTAWLGVALLLPAGLGAYTGVRLQGRFSELTFRRIIAGVLLLTGVSLIVRTLGQA